jgi:hypothetical protein
MREDKLSEIAFTESTTKPENRGHHKDTPRADTLVGSGEMVMLGPREDELSELANTLSTARRERLDMAHRNALRLLKLVNTLPDFSSIEARRMNANYEATDLATCTAELASTFRSATEKGGRSLTVDCPALPEPVYVVCGDRPGRLRPSAVRPARGAESAVHKFYGGSRLCGGGATLDLGFVGRIHSALPACRDS